MGANLKSKSVLFTVAWVLQAICMAFLLASVSTTRYKVNDATNMGIGQYMVCPKNGDPGCENTGDLVMLTVGKWASAIQVVTAIGLMAYLSFFGLLHQLKKVDKYLSNEMQQNLYFLVILMAFVSFMGGLYGPICITWCMEDEMPDLDFGYSMYLHWIQMPFSCLSMLVVAFLPIFESQSAAVESDEKM